MWPDHGAPDEADYKTIYCVLNKLRETRAHTDQKIIVHCSAGIGRTGTILALYNIQSSVYALKAKLNSGFKLTPEDKEAL